MSRVVDTYALQIIDAGTTGFVLLPEAAWLKAYLVEAEENLTDLLPDGYTVRITRWDQQGEEGDTP